MKRASDTTARAAALLKDAADALWRRSCGCEPDDPLRLAAELASRVAAAAAQALAEGGDGHAHGRIRLVLRQRKVHDGRGQIRQLQDLADHDLASAAELLRLDQLIANLPPKDQIAALLERAQAAPQSAAFDQARQTLRAMTTHHKEPAQALQLATALWWLGDRKLAHQGLRRALSMGVDAAALCQATHWLIERRHGVLDRFEWVMLRAAEARAVEPDQRDGLAKLRRVLVQDAAASRTRRRPTSERTTTQTQ